MLIYDALAAYYKFDKFSSKYRSDGDRQAIMSVYEFPPSDCFNNEVNLLSRYGINYESFDFLSSFSVKAVITLRNTCSDLLISEASFAY